MKKVRFVGLDVHADTIAVAVAEPGGTVRSVGMIPNRPNPSEEPGGGLGICGAGDGRQNDRLDVRLYRVQESLQVSVGPAFRIGGDVEERDDQFRSFCRISNASPRIVANDIWLADL